MDLAVVMLACERDMGYLRRTLPLLRENLLSRNECAFWMLGEPGDFSREAWREVERLCPGVSWLNVSLDAPPEVDPATFDVPVEKFSVKYRSMCRLFSHGIFDVFPGFRYVCRVDSDSFFFTPVGEIVGKMEAANAVYAFRGYFHDNPIVMAGLLPLVRRVTGQPLKNMGVRVFYNNFYVASVPEFQSKRARDVFGAIDSNGGIYRTRWGDAPIHTYVVNALWPDRVLVRRDFVYGHANKLVLEGESQFVYCRGLWEWARGDRTPPILRPYVDG